MLLIIFILTQTLTLMRSLLKRINIMYTANWLLIIGFIILVIGLISFGWRQWNIDTDLVINSTLLSNLGSFLSGTVGTLWSLASVLYFILALKEQRKDIVTNQKALALQIKELEDTRMVYQDQSTIFKAQTFENTFFQLLKLHSDNARDIKHTPFSDEPLQTFDMFNTWKTSLNSFLKGSLMEGGEDEQGLPLGDRHIIYSNTEEIKEAFESRYSGIYSSYENVFNHYFRQLYHIFKYIYRSELVPNDKKAFYASLVRAQLSQDELHAIAFNALAPGYGKPKFLFLINEFDILKNYNPDKVPNNLVWQFFNDEKNKATNPWL